MSHSLSHFTAWQWHLVFGGGGSAKMFCSLALKEICYNKKPRRKNRAKTVYFSYRRGKYKKQDCCPVEIKIGLLFCLIFSPKKHLLVIKDRLFIVKRLQWAHFTSILALKILPQIKYESIIRKMFKFSKYSMASKVVLSEYSDWWVNVKAGFYRYSLSWS